MGIVSGAIPPSGRGAAPAYQKLGLELIPVFQGYLLAKDLDNSGPMDVFKNILKTPVTHYGPDLQTHCFYQAVLETRRPGPGPTDCAGLHGSRDSPFDPADHRSGDWTA